MFVVIDGVLVDQLADDVILGANLLVVGALPLDACLLVVFQMLEQQFLADRLEIDLLQPRQGKRLEAVIDFPRRQNRDLWHVDGQFDTRVLKQPGMGRLVDDDRQQAVLQ